MHHHKSHDLKQSNKTFKGSGGHASKRALKRVAPGRVEAAIKGVQSSKARRQNQAKQARKAKRDDALSARRKAAVGITDPPRLLMLLPLSLHADVAYCRQQLHSGCAADNAPVPSGIAGATTSTLRLPENKQRLTVMECGRDLMTIIDSAAVADMVGFVVSAAEDISATGRQYMSCLKALGMATPLLFITGMDKLDVKDRAEARQAWQKYFEREVHDTIKVSVLDSAGDVVNCLRMLSNHKIVPPAGRDPRAHLLGDRIATAPTEDPEKVTLHIGGYLRSQSLSANQLLHIAGVGSFKIRQILSAPDPCDIDGVVRARRASRAGAMAVDAAGPSDGGGEAAASAGVVLSAASDALQESLQAENELDLMENEQTWPTEEELAEASEAGKKKKLVRRSVKVKGMSDYQAAWIPDDEIEEEYVYEDDDDDDGMSEDGEDDDDEEEQPEAVVAAESDDEMDEELLDEEYQRTVEDLDSERQRLRLRSQQDAEFPDEMDTPIGKPARERFQRYRGLKSFRTSPWDPRENLPIDYGRIFQFEAFRNTMKHAKRQRWADSVEPGRYVEIVVEAVPLSALASFFAGKGKPMLCCALLKHEQKMTMVHYTVQKHADYGSPLKSKEELVFVCGFRRFVSQPLFSEAAPRGDRTKLERFLQPGKSCFASVYAPVQYPPGPVLIFKRKASGTMTLAATGMLKDVHTDRLLLKRIVLTGYPFKTHKRRAVVRFMFFTPEDIKYFKPVELWTKHGRSGHIAEPLGTHGHMKCWFDQAIPGNDTVCMSLYKRVYPKYPTAPTDLLVKHAQQ